MVNDSGSQGSDSEGTRQTAVHLLVGPLTELQGCLSVVGFRILWVLEAEQIDIEIERRLRRIVDEIECRMVPSLREVVERTDGFRRPKQVEARPLFDGLKVAA